MLKNFAHCKRVNLVFGKKIQITLVNFKCDWINFDCCKRQKMNKQSINLVTLSTAIKSFAQIPQYIPSFPEHE